MKLDQQIAFAYGRPYLDKLKAQAKKGRHAFLYTSDFFGCPIQCILINENRFMVQSAWDEDTYLKLEGQLALW